jgi:hypothetical protein
MQHQQFFRCHEHRLFLPTSKFQDWFLVWNFVCVILTETLAMYKEMMLYKQMQARKEIDRLFKTIDNITVTNSPKNPSVRAKSME